MGGTEAVSRTEAVAPGRDLPPPEPAAPAEPAVPARAADVYAPVGASSPPTPAPAASGLQPPTLTRPATIPTGRYGALLRRLPTSVTDANEQPVRPNLQRYTLLYFGAEWCPICRQLNEQLGPIYAQTRPGGDFEVLYVSADQPGKRAVAMRTMPWNGTNATMTQSLTAMARPTGYPTVVFIDANGDEVDRMVGIDPKKLAPYLSARSAPGPDPIAESVAFERSFRAGGRPVTPASLTRIVSMGPNLWKPDELIADFNATRRPEQKGILVVAKTEFCSSNGYRACAVTTAVLEKRFPELKVYMAWIHHPDAFRAAGEPRSAKASLDQRIVDEYAFDQGPGATLVFLDPRTGARVRTDARQQ